LPELTRCVEDLGFVGCNVNPDISGGLQPFTPSLADEYWYPLWERLVELDVPCMIHASTTNNPAFHINGAHYIAWHYTAVVELCASRVWQEFPTLKVIIPHGGGGIPFQWNRHRALHVLQNAAPFEEAVRHLYFDTSVYDADSLEMLVRKVGERRVLFGSEMFGTALSRDPQTGRGFDDIIPMLESMPGVTAQGRAAILADNALRVFPRLANRVRLPEVAAVSAPR
jgi:4-oxalmesaconate hydratase